MSCSRLANVVSVVIVNSSQKKAWPLLLSAISLSLCTFSALFSLSLNLQDDDVPPAVKDSFSLFKSLNSFQYLVLHFLHFCNYF
ncbi:hypothetical protein L6452_15989 [Arctium lappa]|uniref:Uncharacterized protein n=1 Tax=Arctium lappa TaxID=4217 RepID=A0ACB9CQ25_ARCLA|nr:hypothetical protein L6452_15989 [Arctium lappa]